MENIMSNRSFTLDQLTEGIRDRHVGADNSRLISKWTRTGLLRGLNEHKRENMARLLENQAAQVLREASSLGAGGGDVSTAGDINGFSNIASMNVWPYFLTLDDPFISMQDHKCSKIALIGKTDGITITIQFARDNMLTNRCAN